MKISGEMQCSGRVELGGQITGVFTGDCLEVHEGGMISGEIRAEKISCHGKLDGRIMTKQLFLGATACHTGIAETKELKIEPGARLDCLLQAGVAEAQILTQAAPVVRMPKIDLRKVLNSFDDFGRSCCMDVPWSKRQEMYNSILELLARGKPLIKVLGEQGSGKTELFAKLKAALPDIFEIITVDNPVGSVNYLLQEVANNLGVTDTETFTQAELLKRIGAMADAMKKQGRRLVWLIDDVQQMYPASLEGVIHILADAFGDGNGHLQMIIFGNDEMQKTLVATVLEYFEDETNCQLELEPLSIKDTADYLRFALQLHGGREGAAYVSLFPYETIREIHRVSRGNIAEINRIASQALKKCFQAGASEVTVDLLE